MADVKNGTARKGFLSLLQCAGKCSRKLEEKEEKVEKKKCQASLCFTKLCSCFLCLLRKGRRNRQESEKSAGEDDSKLFDLIFKVQNRRMDDQRSVFPVKPASVTVLPPDNSFRNQVTGDQADLPKIPEIIIHSASEQDLQQEGSVSDTSFQTAATESIDDDEFFDCLEKQPADLPRSSRERRVTFVEPKLRVPNFADLAYISTLGRGAFGSVELVTLRKDQSRSFALKCIEKKATVDMNWQTYVYSEKKILMEADCPFIIKLFGTYKDSKYVYMLLEACLGGDLHRCLYNSGCFDNNTASFYAGCVVLGLEYLHDRGIAHRDLKPENMLLDSRGYLKLGDLGLASQSGVGCKMHSDRGTRYYKAPEMFLQKPYDITVDYWSLGVIVYQFLSGKRPFIGDKRRVTIAVCKGFGNVTFPRRITSVPKDLIKRLCRRNPIMRLGKNGVADIKQHAWFSAIDWDALECQSLSPPINPMVTGPTDTQHFRRQLRRTASPPDETSGWDADF